MATIGERIIETLGGMTATGARELVDKAETRAYEAGYNDGNDEPPSGDLSSYGYKQESGAGRNLSVSHEKALQTAWKLWQSSLIANRAMSLKRDFILDRGVVPSAPDSEDLQAIFDDFAQSNKWDRRHKEFVKQLFGFGEQCFTVFVRESDGAVKLGYIDPEEIERVICNPDNALEQWAVVTKKMQGADAWQSDAQERVYRIVRTCEKGKYEGRLVTAVQAEKSGEIEAWEYIMLKEYALSEYTGSCFYEGVNRVSNQARGYTDMLQAADWIDQVDNALFAMLDREQFAGFFSFDVKLTGADAAEVTTRSKKIRNSPPKKGSVNVHNENEEWDMFAPDIKQAQSVAGYKGGLGHILGGLGFPVHWYGFGDDANRATAAAQGEPTEKSLAHDQGIVRDMITLIFTFVRDQAVTAGYLSIGEDDETVLVEMPEITPSDATKAVAVLAPLAQALTLAVQSGWITNDTAAGAYHKALSEFGVEVDTAEETKAAQVEKDDNDEVQAEKSNANLAAKLFQNVSGDNGD